MPLLVDSRAFAVNRVWREALFSYTLRDRRDDAPTRELVALIGQLVADARFSESSVS
jgi:hypothetical protein